MATASNSPRFHVHHRACSETAVRLLLTTTSPNFVRQEPFTRSSTPASLLG